MSVDGWNGRGVDQGDGGVGEGEGGGQGGRGGGGGEHPRATCVVSLCRHHVEGVLKGLVLKGLAVGAISDCSSITGWGDGG